MPWGAGTRRPCVPRPCGSRLSEGARRTRGIPLDRQPLAPSVPIPRRPMSESLSLNNPHELALRDFALGYPGTHEDFPWGHRALKVKGKAFLFMGSEDGGLGLSVKLPHS